MREGVLHDLFRGHVPADSVEEQWDLAGLEKALAAEYLMSLPILEWFKTEGTLSDEQALRRILDAANAVYQAKVDLVGGEQWHPFERNVMLQSLDTHWREHLAALDHLRQGIHLRGYAQQDPKQAYKREAFQLFEGLLDAVRNEVSKLLMTVQIRSAEDIEQMEEAEQAPAVDNVQYHHASYEEALAQPISKGPAERVVHKVGRNDPCPCGSGKKYKHCHGKLA